MSKDLRKVVDSIMRRWGHNILLQRRDDDYDAANPAFSNTLETHTVRHMHSSSQALPGDAVEAIEGVIHNSEAVYYFRWNANPAEGDRIYENIELYPNNMQTYLIDVVVPMRFHRGRIEYWVVGASRETPK